VLDVDDVHTQGMLDLDAFLFEVFGPQRLVGDDLRHASFFAKNARYSTR
jgi:hypothetical protein